MRALLMLVIGLTFGFGGGFLAGGGMGEGGHAHDHAGHGAEGHDHSALVEWITTDFTFDPLNVNAASVPGTGHAHIYVNGAKVARAYSPFMLIEGVTPGDVIRVTLNTNDHSGWSLNGTPIAKEITVE